MVELERQILQRTVALAATTEELRKQVADRREAERRLLEANEQLRALSLQIQSAREEERGRIAREVHDELGSELTGLRWDLEELEKLCLPPRPTQRRDVKLKIAAMLSRVDCTIRVVRRIASELRPIILDDLGLLEAMEYQAEQFQSRSGIRCTYERAVSRIDLTKERSTAIFRICQEALTNVLRHARATDVRIAIFMDEGDLVFKIADNGRGIGENQKSSPGSLGVLGMQERARLAGASVDIQGVENEGTTVTVRVRTTPSV